jgi:hypothetical protein
MTAGDLFWSHYYQEEIIPKPFGFPFQDIHCSNMFIFPPHIYGYGR